MTEARPDITTHVCPSYPSCPLLPAPASGVKGVKVPLLPLFGVLCAIHLQFDSVGRVPEGRTLRMMQGTAGI
jgi:hypothetical protein